MKRIEDIKEFKDIDTYYGISNIVEEVFQDRVEAHKHLIIANKEIEQLNEIIKELINENNRLRTQIINLRNHRIIFVDNDKEYDLPIQKYK